jgi:hypothetical protein
MNNEVLWDDFKATLNQAFKDTNKIDDTAIDLERLKMAQKEELGKVSPLVLLCGLWLKLVDFEKVRYKIK